MPECRAAPVSVRTVQLRSVGCETGRSLPRQLIDLRHSARVRRQEDDETQAVRKVRIAGKVRAWRIYRRRADALKEAEAFDQARHQQILQKIASIKIDVGTDF